MKVTPGDDAVSQAYDDAWAERSAGTDAALWESVIGDGLTTTLVA